MKLFCQCVIAVAIGARLFGLLHYNFHGRKEMAAPGFPGAVASIVIMAIYFAVLYSAGAFSELTGE